VLIQQIQGIWLDHPGRCAIESPERVILIWGKASCMSFASPAASAMA
jgi:hypothetical protein